MRIEERGCNMITDKQGVEWLFKKLYDAGWRYYARNIGGTAFLTTKKPIMNQGILEITSGGTTMCINNISEIMPEIKRNEVLNIAEELGIVDWSKVAVDTPVLVSNDGKNWCNRYFSSFDGVNVIAWEYGATSWSVDDADSEVYRWEYAKLAEV